MDVFICVYFDCEAHNIVGVVGRHLYEMKWAEPSQAPK